MCRGPGERVTERWTGRPGLTGEGPIAQVRSLDLSENTGGGENSVIEDISSGMRRVPVPSQ